MRCSKLVQTNALSLVAVMAFGAQATFAAGPVAAGKSSNAKTTAPAVIDVALQDGGVLTGQVVNLNGTPQAGSQVRLLQNGRAVAEVVTNGDGRFVVRGLRGGLHEIQTAESIGVYGLWTPGTAPPSARPGASLISNSTVMRGQQAGWGDPAGFAPAGRGPYGCRPYGCGPYGCGNPLVYGAIIGGLVTGGTYFLLDNNPAGS